MRRRPDGSFACETNAYFRCRNREKKKRAIFKSANFSSIATDDKGVIQIFNVGAERMLGFTTEDVINKITPADISDPQEVITHAKALSAELGTVITPGFEALVFKASRGIEDIYEITYIYAFPTSGLDYLTKPFQIEELHACVETHLKIRRQQRDLEVCSHDLEVVHTRMQLDLDLSHQVGVTRHQLNFFYVTAPKTPEKLIISVGSENHPISLY